VELLAFEGRASHVSGWLAGYGLVLPRSPRIRELSREGAQRRPRGQKQPCTRTGLDSLENDFFFFFETCVDKGAGSSEKVCSAAAGASYVLIRVSPPLKFFHKPRISCVCVPHPTLLPSRIPRTMASRPRTESSAGRLLLTKDRSKRLLTSNWGAIYINFGFLAARDQMSGYYSNVAMIAALIGGFTVSSVMSDPPDSSGSTVCAHDNSCEVFLSASVGAMGSLAFIIFFACVLDCIFIDNALRQLPNEEAFLQFLETQREWLGVSCECESLKLPVCTLLPISHPSS
jgi:hypothetical protein